jgi:hypothetical protein
MSALGSEADMCSAKVNVHYGPIADVGLLTLAKLFEQSQCFLDSAFIVSSGENP